jgi:hypothetical protein
MREEILPAGIPGVLPGARLTVHRFHDYAGEKIRIKATPGYRIQSAMGPVVTIRTYRGKKGITSIWLRSAADRATLFDVVVVEVAND